jgi:oligopeptidase B
VLEGREDGIPRIWVAQLPPKDAAATTSGSMITSMERLTFAEDAYDVGMARHYEFNTDQLVVGYDSLVTPAQSIQIDMNHPSDMSKRVVLKEKLVPGYNRSEYACERTVVRSRDGSTEIPVSLVYRKDVMESHQASGQPVYTHLYGTYVECI